jgi:FAD-dependent oxidoreductase domain-containing protein 1
MSTTFCWAHMDRGPKVGLIHGPFFVHCGTRTSPWGYVDATRRTAAGAIESVRLFHIDTGETESVSVDLVVNAAGAYSGALLDLLTGGGGPAGQNGVVLPLPVKPRKRCAFFFQCDMKQPDALVPTLAPLTVDATGVYFRSEGPPGRGTFVGGVSPSLDNDRDCWDPVTDLSVDHYLWDDIIWPTLFHRVPAFGAVKVVSSWAGLYDYNTLDQNAIIDFHPDIPNLLLVTGFSGHGLQHSPAAGRAAAELLSHGRFQSCDLSIFSFQRCIDNRPVFEQGIV